MKYLDYIIVGQGIAGSLLAWNLLKDKKKVVIIDERRESAASMVSAGIMHPVTGRRIVKTWMADHLLPFAESTYREIEILLEETFFQPLKIMELISGPKEYNDWMERSGDPELAGFISNNHQDAQYSEYLYPYYKSILVNKSSWIHTGKFLSSFRKYFVEHGHLSEEEFKEDLLLLRENDVAYGDFAATKIIFCDGVDAVRNSFWSYLPFIPSKGEVLTIRAGMELEHIINHKVFILPLGGDLFRVGSTYSWNPLDDIPSLQGREYLVSQLSAILKIPFEIVEHKASVRPTVKDRRPFLGLHPEYGQVGIFNGLGTKGCLLAPYFANHLAGFLSGKNELMKEVDVRNRNRNSTTHG